MATKEKWVNSTKGRVVLGQIDRRGNITHKILRGGDSIDLSYDERMMNSEGAALESLDPFKNGTMVPVRFADDTEDKAEIDANPNLKSEDELRKLFGLHWKKFEIAVDEINNATTLNRMREIAQEGDATVRQVEVIQKRIAEVTPGEAVTDVVLAT